MKDTPKPKENYKLDPMIVSTKYHEVNSDFNELLKEQFSNKNIINDFSPFISNDILVIEATKNSIIILLKNGTVISIGEDSHTLGRKIIDLNDKLKPNKILFKKPIVDISCGRDHCLAKSDEYRVYTWGNNFYGQLGLPNFPMTWESNKEEPTEIVYFSQKMPIQIKCGNYNSFCIDEENNLYGWGSNENGQLLVDSDTKKIPTPMILPIKENINDMLILPNKESKKFYILEVFRKINNFINPEAALSNEYELKQEVIKLTLELNEVIKKSGGVQLKEGETLEEVRLNNIQSLINSFEEKINEIELFLLANKNKGTEQIINSINKQIDFNSYLESQFKNKQNYISNTIDYEKMKKGIETNSSSTNGNINNTNFPSNQTNNSLTPNENVSNLRTPFGTQNQNNLNVVNNRIISIDELLDRANSELKMQKDQVLSEKNKVDLERKEKEKEIKKLVEYMNLFEKVKEDYKKYTELKANNEKIKDVEYTLKKLDREIQNFDINLLKNLDKLNYENNSLLEILEQSLGNIKKLDQKILSMNIDQSNDISKKIISNFYTNSNLAKQNNILMQEIIFYSQTFYHRIFDKLLKPSKIDNFTKLKETIDLKKQSFMIDEENEVSDEENEENSFENQDDVEEETEDYI